MKANQAFQNNDEAVSPVIGVILMVAITVVLAAVVFVLVSGLGKNSNSAAPNMSFTQDKSAQTLTVVSSDQAKWSDIKVTTNTAVCTASTPPATAITAGDKLTMTKVTAGTCTLTLTYTPANQLLGSWDFVFT